MFFQVITLKSGLQYKVLRKGSGEYAPKVGITCECHYAGTTPSLTEDAITKDEADWNGIYFKIYILKYTLLYLIKNYYLIIFYYNYYYIYLYFKT